MHANPENPKNRGRVDTNKNTNTFKLFNPVKNQIRMLENGEWEWVIKKNVDPCFKPMLISVF